MILPVSASQVARIMGLSYIPRLSYKGNYLIKFGEPFSGQTHGLPAVLSLNWRGTELRLERYLENRFVVTLKVRSTELSPMIVVRFLKHSRNRIR
jgi:hypothetical protein